MNNEWRGAVGACLALLHSFLQWNAYRCANTPRRYKIVRVQVALLESHLATLDALFSLLVVVCALVLPSISDSFLLPPPSSLAAVYFIGAMAVALILHILGSCAFHWRAYLTQVRCTTLLAAAARAHIGLLSHQSVFSLTPWACAASAALGAAAAISGILSQAYLSTPLTPSDDEFSDESLTPLRRSLLLSLSERDTEMEGDMDADETCDSHSFSSVTLSTAPTNK